MALTQEQIDFFHTNGYLRYGPLLSAEELALLREQYDLEFERAWASNQFANLTLPYDSRSAEEKRQAERQMYQIVQMCERNLHFRRQLYHPTMLAVFTDLMGPNLQLFHDQALFKPAHTGGPVYWHQDNAYWKCRPATLISCWLTLDDVVCENGAMQVIPGSHLTPIWHDPQTTNPLLQVDTRRLPAPVVIDLPAGGCMFHHCQTLHYTQPNSTPNQRRALAIHVMTPGTVQHGDKAMPISFSRPLLQARW
jgi:ectoine hydroxylase-related dioxygenase (phytanoyl-CoA dioxygenase family)